MIEVKNKLYTQRFFAHKLLWSDLFRAVTYTQFEGKTIPFWYKKRRRNTVTLDLSIGLEDLFANMKSNTRNEIRRAEREGCVFELNHDYEAFVKMYNHFCESKGIHGDINTATLSKYNGMIIAVVRYNGVSLAMHATVINLKDKEAMLLYSCSNRLDDNVDRKLIGWGNRFLHYKEFEYMIQKGIERYEWNGVCIDPEEVEKYKIGQFKLGFGGQTKPSVHLRTPLFLIMKSVQIILIWIKKTIVKK